MSGYPINMNEARPPGLLRRLAAIAYDGLLVAGLMLFASAIDLFVIPSYSSQLVKTWPLLVPPLLFFPYFWTRGGQTLGMRAWRIRVVRDDGQPLTTGDALLRFCAALLSWAPAGLGFLWSLADPERLAWHDRLSKTRLVLLGRGNA